MMDDGDLYFDILEDPRDCSWEDDTPYGAGRCKTDPDAYHRPLFFTGEQHVLTHKTDKAYLFTVRDGSFWVPKSLVRYYPEQPGSGQTPPLVWYKFKRRYLPEPKPVNH